MTSYIPPSILPSPIHSFPTTNAVISSSTGASSGLPPQQESSVMGNRPGDVNDFSIPAKMFVGGLPQIVNQGRRRVDQSVPAVTLRNYFERFGPINEAFILMDELSGRSRGFGFVTFENSSTLLQVLASGPHYLEGKHVDCKHAVLKNSNSNVPRAVSTDISTPWTRALKVTEAAGTVAAEKFEDFQPGGEEEEEEDVYLTGGGKSYLALSGDKWLEDCAEADERKIFVGGLPDVTLCKNCLRCYISPAEFAGFFEHFGPVADAMVMFDRKRRRQRGFGFITFATLDGVAKALQYSRHPVKGKLVTKTDTSDTSI